ncbi:MAG: DUF3795 domain-containing protein [Desulfobacteraceae bacterium]|nr:MAG: DUF3795 domain-containing protein [Desulfobacteraceae bacterium]
MKPVTQDTNLVAKCGLYCGACPRYLKGKCAGCSENHKASWCKSRSCCMEKGFRSCADCSDHDDVMTCPKFDTLTARLFGLVFNSDRAACIRSIRDVGYEQYADTMTREKRMTFKRR